MNNRMDMISSRVCNISFTTRCARANMPQDTIRRENRVKRHTFLGRKSVGTGTKYTYLRMCWSCNTLWLYMVIDLFSDVIKYLQ